MAQFSTTKSFARILDKVINYNAEYVESYTLAVVGGEESKEVDSNTRALYRVRRITLFVDEILERDPEAQFYVTLKLEKDVSAPEMIAPEIRRIKKLFKDSLRVDTKHNDEQDALITENFSIKLYPCHRSCMNDCPVCHHPLYFNLRCFDCGHMVHKACYESMQRWNIDTCPLCSRKIEGVTREYCPFVFEEEQNAQITHLYQGPDGWYRSSMKRVMHWFRGDSKRQKSQ